MFEWEVKNEYFGNILSCESFQQKGNDYNTRQYTICMYIK